MKETCSKDILPVYAGLPDRKDEVKAAAVARLLMGSFVCSSFDLEDLALLRNSFESEFNSIKKEFQIKNKDHLSLIISFPDSDKGYC